MEYYVVCIGQAPGFVQSQEQENKKLYKMVSISPWVMYFSGVYINDLPVLENLKLQITC